MTIETRPLPATEPRTKTVADVLRHAALIIEERGWVQFVRDGAWEGRTGHCIVGAVEVAQYGFAESCSMSRDPYGLPAIEAVESLIGKVAPDWNDTPGRTASEVTAALRAAADAAEGES